MPAGARSFLLGLLAAGCRPAPPPTPVSAASAAPTVAQPRAIDFAEPGPHAVEASEHALDLEGCRLQYTLYQPDTGPDAPLVVLGHGFSRNPRHVAGLATHFTSHGLRVATPAYCHASAFDADHAQNGRDAAALSAKLSKGGPVAHAGHSAGGLAAWLAAAEDPGAVAMLGLDLVDRPPLGRDAAMSLPALDLVADAGSCNADGNGLPLFSGEAKWVARIPGSTHCDFEAPTDLLCTTVCGGRSDGAATIRAVATAFLVWQLGLDPRGRAWASPDGERWRELVDHGALQPS